MKLRPLPVLLALAGMLSFAARAESDLESRVDGYLGSIDTAVKVEQWRALGPEALAILDARLRSADALPTVRARAAEALGLVGTPEHADALLALAGQSEAPLVVRLSAIRSAGKLLPADRVEQTLTPMLEKDPNARVRATAGDVLAERLGASGCEKVRKRAKAEDRITQGMYARAMKRCKSGR